MLTIKLTRDTLTPSLRRMLKDAQSNGRLGTVLGRAAANTLKKHFRKRNQRGNKLGGKRTNFWSRVAESVQSPRSQGGQIIVHVGHPAIGQKVHGGRITAKKAKNLAIPVHRKAYGNSPRVFSGLQFAVSSSGAKMLVLTAAERDARGRFTGLLSTEVYYILKKSVIQDADPNALPKESEMAEALEKAGRIALRPR